MKRLWHDKAWDEYLYRQTQDKKTLKKINRLPEDISRHGYECTGQPEPLSGNPAGYWSVRIDEKNRLAPALLLANIEILDFDAVAAESYGKIRADLEKKGIPIGSLDMMIAGHAMSIKYAVVTNNIKEFGRIKGLYLENQAE